MSRVRKILDLSTDHLPLEARESLDDWESITGCTVYATPHGCLMWVPDDPKESAQGQEEGPSAELLAVQVYARGLDCDYVNFDCDAEADEGLPCFDAAEQPCK